MDKKRGAARILGNTGASMVYVFAVMTFLIILCMSVLAAAMSSKGYAAEQRTYYQIMLLDDSIHRSIMHSLQASPSSLGNQLALALRNGNVSCLDGCSPNPNCKPFICTDDCKRSRPCVTPCWCCKCDPSCADVDCAACAAACEDDCPERINNNPRCFFGIKHTGIVLNDSVSGGKLDLTDPNRYVRVEEVKIVFPDPNGPIIGGRKDFVEAIFSEVWVDIEPKCFYAEGSNITCDGGGGVNPCCMNEDDLSLLFCDNGPCSILTGVTVGIGPLLAHRLPEEITIQTPMWIEVKIRADNRVITTRAIYEVSGIRLTDDPTGIFAEGLPCSHYLFPEGESCVNPAACVVCTPPTMTWVDYGDWRLISHEIISS